jgi:hypothetical protein
LVTDHNGDVAKLRGSNINNGVTISQPGVSVPVDATKITTILIIRDGASFCVLKPLKLMRSNLIISFEPTLSRLA